MESNAAFFGRKSVCYRIFKASPGGVLPAICSAAAPWCLSVAGDDIAALIHIDIVTTNAPHPPDGYKRMKGSATCQSILDFSGLFFFLRYLQDRAWQDCSGLFVCHRLALVAARGPLPLSSFLCYLTTSCIIIKRKWYFLSRTKRIFCEHPSQYPYFLTLFITPRPPHLFIDIKRPSFQLLFSTLDSNM